MKILSAGGGTAGHIEPALAVARAWQGKYPLDEIAFLGTALGLENTLVPQAGYRLHLIPKVSISRKISTSLLFAPFQLVRSIVESMRVLKGFDCAIGFGGYVSGPLYFAAFLMRIPFVIHEQNARPGWANRVGALLTQFTAISYPVGSGRLSKAELTGLPLRADVIEALELASKDWESARRAAKVDIALRYGFDVEAPLIFVFGGSQGSQALNSVIEGARSELELLGVSILHGVGKKNSLPEPSSGYRAIGYIEDMATSYLAADLLIARSGAVTCAEANALVRYSLFIPLPVGNGEQALNAQSLVDAGRAEITVQSEFTSTWLSSNILSLIAKSGERTPEGSATAVGAADKIVAIIERAAGV